MCIYILLHQGSGFPGDLAVKKPHLQCRRCRFDPWSGRSPGRGHGNPVVLPGKVHGQRSLAGCSPWGYMTEHTCMRVEGDGLVVISWQNFKEKKRTTYDKFSIYSVLEPNSLPQPPGSSKVWLLICCHLLPLVLLLHSSLLSSCCFMDFKCSFLSLTLCLVHFSVT